MNNDKALPYFRELLAYHEFLKERQERELAELPPGSLGMRCDGAETQYCRYLGGKRQGITKDAVLTEKLARKKFLEKSLSRISGNIGCLNKLLEKYEDIDEAGIIREFPPQYAALMDRKAAEWLKYRNLWASEDYERSTYAPWEKDHVTAKGLRVRSKSEVIIAERLDFYGIAYRYEQMIFIERYAFAPDFTILTSEGVKYWEHAGCVNDREYMRRHNWKVNMYSRGGIVPWKNLIITYDDENGRFDSRIIEAEIANKLLPYC